MLENLDLIPTTVIISIQLARKFISYTLSVLEKRIKQSIFNTYLYKKSITKLCRIFATEKVYQK